MAMSAASAFRCGSDRSGWYGDSVTSPLPACTSPCAMRTAKSKPGSLAATGAQAHGEDGVCGRLDVLIMRHLGEGVDHRRAIGVGWLGGGQHGQAQGHRPAHRHVAVLEDVVEVADGHLSAQLLPPRHQRDPERGNRLR
eukprot:scaffold29387_cov116-Isochrysis_galbana.AAC.1